MVQLRARFVPDRDELGHVQLAERARRARRESAHPDPILRVDLLRYALARSDRRDDDDRRDSGASAGIDRLDFDVSAPRKSAQSDHTRRTRSGGGCEHAERHRECHEDASRTVHGAEYDEHRCRPRAFP